EFSIAGIRDRIVTFFRSLRVFWEPHRVQRTRTRAPVAPLAACMVDLADARLAPGKLAATMSPRHRKRPVTERGDDDDQYHHQDRRPNNRRLTSTRLAGTAGNPLFDQDDEQPGHFAGSRRSAVVCPASSWCRNLHACRMCPLPEDDQCHKPQKPTHLSSPAPGPWGRPFSSARTSTSAPSSRPTRNSRCRG